MQRVFLSRLFGVIALSWMMMFGVGVAVGQSTSGSVSGTVTDSTGAVIPGATVVISNPVSGLSRTATSDSSGAFQFFNLPFNPYHLAVNEAGFQPFSRQIAVNSNVLVTVAVALEVATSSQGVTVGA